VPDLFDVDDLWPHDYERVPRGSPPRKTSARCWPARAWRCCSRSRRPARATRPRWRCSSWAVTRCTYRATRSAPPHAGVRRRTSPAHWVAITRSCAPASYDHDVLARMALLSRTAASTSPWSTCSPTRGPSLPGIADVLTLREILGPLPGQILAYIGDANNMCRSLVKGGPSWKGWTCGWPRLPATRFRLRNSTG